MSITQLKLNELALEYSSGNEIPIERATLTRSRITEIINEVLDRASDIAFTHPNSTHVDIARAILELRLQESE